MISFFRKIRWILSSQFGIDPLLFSKSLIRLPRYFSDLFLFLLRYRGELCLTPCLHDRYQQAGSIKGEYFWQDLFVARLVNNFNPQKHLDIGSRIDGFVAHIASFRKIDVFDVREISANIPNVNFIQMDLMNKEDILEFIQENGLYDSVSCLHVVEHFGLGRYGDKLEINGFDIGLENIANLVSTNGRLYLSTPVGRKRVEFNANWVFDLHEIVEKAKTLGLTLESFSVYDDQYGLRSSVDINLEVMNSEYSLGIFTFLKNNQFL